MDDPQMALAPTGIEGLDDILRGGFPRDRLYLVQGEPGAGKTTLALQFLLEGARAGEKGLYITLSESPDELRQVARSHGWSLDALTIFELQPSAEELAPEHQYTLYHPAEVELREAMQTLLAQVEQVKPRRVVFDSLSEIRLLAQQPLRYRRQIMALKKHFSGSDCTVLLLDDMGEGPEHMRSMVHGVVLLERTAPTYGGARRRMEIVKLRGVRFRDGYHDYRIERGGLQVYPRLVAAEHRPGFQARVLASGIRALDELLGGGLEYGTATLVAGPPGSGKSALATCYAQAMARGGGRAAIFTFDESTTTLQMRAEGLGMSLDESMAAGTIQVQQIDPAEMSPGQFTHLLKTAVQRDKVGLIVIDSLNGYLNAMPEDKLILNQLHELFTYLGQQGIVTLLVLAQHGLLGASMSNPIDVSYLVDNMLLLRYFESAGSVRKALSVVKKRSSSHERTIREFATGPDGIQVGKPLDEFHGVLTGTPVYSGSPKPLLRSDGPRRD